MVYRKTENTKAHVEAQRAAIIAAAIDCIRSGGIAAMISPTIVKKTGMSMGKIYYHFADMGELLAQVEAVIKTRDGEAIEQAAKAQADPIEALTAGIKTLVSRFGNNRPSREMLANSLAYRLTMLRVFERLIGACIDDGDAARTLARAAVGAIRGLAEMDGPATDRAQAAVLFVLKGIGVSEAKAIRAMEAIDG